MLFKKYYPELVDKNTVKYPIEDTLIGKLPILHGAENVVEKPKPKKVLIEGPKFENLLYVWEFCNNFQDFLNSTPFKLEELQAALTFTDPTDEISLYPKPEEGEELSWDQ